MTVYCRGHPLSCAMLRWSIQWITLATSFTATFLIAITRTFFSTIGYTLLAVIVIIFATFAFFRFQSSICSACWKPKHKHLMFYSCNKCVPNTIKVNGKCPLVCGDAITPGFFLLLWSLSLSYMYVGLVCVSFMLMSKAMGILLILGGGSNLF